MQALAIVATATVVAVAVVTAAPTQAVTATSTARTTGIDADSWLMAPATGTVAAAVAAVVACE